jgi:hypothetical protein
LGIKWRALWKEKTHAGLFWIAPNMFTLSVPPFKAGSDLAGNWPLLTAKNYLTSNGNVKTVESSNFTTKLWMKGGKFL